MAVLCAPYARPEPGDFYGTTLAMIEVRYPNVVTLLWTNPPDLDLDTLRFFGAANGDTFRLPDYMGRKETENAPYDLRPGVPDSIWVTLPCRTVPVDWTFWLYAVDTAGNVSEKSNIAAWTQSP